MEDDCCILGCYSEMLPHCLDPLCVVQTWISKLSGIVVKPNIHLPNGTMSSKRWVLRSKVNACFLDSSNQSRVRCLAGHPGHLDHLINSLYASSAAEHPFSTRGIDYVQETVNFESAKLCNQLLPINIIYVMLCWSWIISLEQGQVRSWKILYVQARIVIIQLPRSKAILPRL